MTKAAAIYKFWSGFGIDVYEENSVPDNAKFPYITYQFISDNIGNDLGMTASIWYRSTSWVEINKKTEEIAKYIAQDFIPMKCDNGKVWLKMGTPFSQSMGDESDDLIKRIYLNIIVEYLTDY